MRHAAGPFVSNIVMLSSSSFLPSSLTFMLFTSFSSSPFWLVLSAFWRLWIQAPCLCLSVRAVRFLLVLSAFRRLWLQIPTFVLSLSLSVTFEPRWALFTTFSSSPCSCCQLFWRSGCSFIALFTCLKYSLIYLMPFHKHFMGANNSTMITNVFCFCAENTHDNNVKCERTNIVMQHVLLYHRACAICWNWTHGHTDTWTHGWTNYRWTIKCGAHSCLPPIIYICGNFCQSHHLLSLAKCLSCKFFVLFNDYIENIMVTFIILVKIIII